MSSGGIQVLRSAAGPLASKARGPASRGWGRRGLRRRDVGAEFGKELAEEGAVAARCVGAVATHGKICRVRESGEEGEVVFCGGRGHFGFVFTGESRPLRGRFGGKPELHGDGAGGEIGEPDVIPVLRGEL